MIVRMCSILSYKRLRFNPYFKFSIFTFYIRNMYFFSIEYRGRLNKYICCEFLKIDCFTETLLLFIIYNGITDRYIHLFLIRFTGPNNT